MTTTAHSEEAEAAPSVAIRAKPPSPRRLSRKVLLAGASAACAVIAFSLMLGLSPQTRTRAAQQNATVSASGPPDTIAQARPGYDPESFDTAHGAPSDDAGALLAPADRFWANEAPRSAGQGGVGASAPQASATPGPGPEALARASPILFAAPAGRAQGETSNPRDADEGNLDAQLMAPRSRFEIQAGSVIPAALLTGLNSDLPGRVIAQVTQPVYDSATGGHLLIPQGARLIGQYDNGVRYGDHRILLVWTRLIWPNGWSIDLRQMPASDATGAAGLSDSVDNHLRSLAGAIGLSAVLSVIANNADDDRQGDGARAQSVGDAAAQQAAQTGSQIVERDLSVHLTLRVRPGANVRVLVTRDISLRPYRG